MRGHTKALVLVLVLATMTATPALAKAPDLAACPRPVSPDGGERQRSHPLPVPAALGGILKASVLNYAVATLDGSTLCIDISWMESAEKIALLGDGRFLSFDWLGYESFGHKLVDRSGKGQVVDTGVAPVFSPSRGRLTAADLSESGFGALGAFAVWQVTPIGLRQIANVTEVPDMLDWRIDGWAGEDCVKLSAIPFDKAPADGDYTKVARTRYVAQGTPGTWRIGPAAKGSCPAT